MYYHLPLWEEFQQNLLGKESNPKKMKNKWQNVLFFSLGTMLLINVFCAFFLYQQEWNPVEVSFTVEADFDTFVWTTQQPKFNDSVTKSEIVSIKENVPKKLTINVNKTSGLKFFGVYWSQSDLGTFSITNASLKSNGKIWKVDAAELVSYTSTNVATKIVENVLLATSQERANGWMMLNTKLLEEISKRQKFAPLSLGINVFLFLVLLVLGSFFINKIKRIWLSFQLTGSIIEKTRRYLLSFWVFIFPFWQHVSHVLLAVSLALLILEYLLKRKESPLKEIKLFLPLVLLFIAIVVVNIVFHIKDFGNDFGDYIHFLLMPFVFIGIDKKSFAQIFKAFQWGIMSYCILLLITVFDTYLSIRVSYSFNEFLFETTELYWHTSYLAGLILVAFFIELLQNRITVNHLFIAFLIFVFLFVIQARLPMIIGIFLTIIIWILKLPKSKKYWAFSSLALLGTVAILIVIFSESSRAKISETILVNDTQKLDARPQLWNASLQIFEKNSLTGIGRSNIRAALSKNIEDSSEIKNRGYNTHNQYLEFLISYGIFIPLILLFVLIFPILKKYKYTTVFVIYFALVMLVESYFSRQSGVLIFSLFYCLFIVYDSKD